MLLPASLFLAILALGAFLWSVKDDQFDDLDTPAKRMLLEEETNKKSQ